MEKLKSDSDDPLYVKALTTTANKRFDMNFRVFGLFQ